MQVAHTTTSRPLGASCVLSDDVAAVCLSSAPAPESVPERSLASCAQPLRPVPVRLHGGGTGAATSGLVQVRPPTDSVPEVTSESQGTGSCASEAGATCDVCPFCSSSESVRLRFYTHDAPGVRQRRRQAFLAAPQPSSRLGANSRLRAGPFLPVRPGSSRCRIYFRPVGRRGAVARGLGRCPACAGREGAPQAAGAMRLEAWQRCDGRAAPSSSSVSHPLLG